MKFFKSTIAFLVVIALMLAVAACSAPAASDADSSANASAEATTGEGVQIASASDAKVAFIMGGPISDMSWNYTGYQGLMMMEEEGAQVVYQENTDPSNIVESVRTYASEGYNIIFINDDTNQEDVVNTIQDFPETQEFICNGTNHTENVDYLIYHIPRSETSKQAAKGCFSFVFFLDVVAWGYCSPLSQHSWQALPS